MKWNKLLYLGIISIISIYLYTFNYLHTEIAQSNKMFEDIKQEMIDKEKVNLQVLTEDELTYFKFKKVESKVKREDFNYYKELYDYTNVSDKYEKYRDKIIMFNRYKKLNNGMFIFLLMGFIIILKKLKK